MTGTDSRTARILLVEDNPGDADLVREAFESRGFRHRLRVAEDGVEALRLLRLAGPGSEVPDLILLDLNLPRMDGREVLAEIRRDPRLRGIPVVVLTSSLAEADLVRVADLQAEAYFAKPLDLPGFLRTAEAIEGVWRSLDFPPSQEVPHG